MECRNSGGAHTLVFTFSSDIVSGSARVESGEGNVLGTPIFAGNTMTVNLTGVLNAQMLKIELSNVTDVPAQVLPVTLVNMGVLIGDTTGNGSVNASDVNQTKSKSGQTVDASNVRADLNVNGQINDSDVSFVKSKSGNAIP